MKWMITDQFRRKRIIFFFGCLELGGAERQGLMLAEYMMSELGAEVQVWGFHGPGKVAALCEEKGIPWNVVELPLAGSRYGLPGRWARFIRRLREARADILLPYTMTPNVVCGLAWKLAGVKLCVWSQRDEGLERQARWLEYLSTKMIHSFVANSSGSARFLAESMKVPQGRIRTIHNGVSLPAPSCSRKEWRVRLSAHEDEVLVAMIGNISPFKDHPTLIGAWRQVLDSFRGRAKLLLVGNQLNIERVDEVKRLVSSAGVDGSVIFLDRIDDIAGFLNAIDLVVHASKSEGLSNAVLEAMAAGRAVVGSDIPGIREVLGNTGVYVPVGNKEALATAIVQLLEDENERARLGDRNRSAVQNEFSSRRMCEQTVEFLDASWREA